jgi:hypothetical protein
MPLTPVLAKALLRRLLEEGKFIAPSARSHARQEMNKDGLTDVDLVNVLRGGTVEPPEWENGEWRYRVRTQRMTVVVAFEPDPEDAESEEEIELFIVTAWRT